MTHTYDDLIFLCGPLRSGTTLSRILLTQHPEITARGESDYYFDASASALRQGRDRPSDRQWFAQDLAEQRIARAQGVRPPPLAPLPDMVRALIDQERPETGRLLLTLHRHTDLAARLFPGAAFIRLRRDPRDVAISAMKMGWAGNPYRGADVWLQAEAAWREAEPLITGPKVELIFEAMTADPRSELTRVLSALGLPFDEAVLSPPLESTYSAPSPARNHAWRKRLTERAAGEIDWRVGALCDDGLYDVQPCRPSLFRRLQLEVENKAGRHSFAVRRYGRPLAYAHKLAFRLALPGRASILRRIDAIDTPHLK
jgi:hypothetical protein